MNITNQFNVPAKPNRETVRQISVEARCQKERAQGAGRWVEVSPLTRLEPMFIRIDPPAAPAPPPPAFKPGDMVRLGLYFYEVVSYSPKARRVRYRKLAREKPRVQHMLRRVFEKTAVPA